MVYTSLSAFSLRWPHYYPTHTVPIKKILVTKITEKEQVQKKLHMFFQLLVAYCMQEVALVLVGIQTFQKSGLTIQLTATGDSISGSRKATRKNFRALISAFSSSASPKAMAYSTMIARV